MRSLGGPINVGVVREGDANSYKTTKKNCERHQRSGWVVLLPFELDTWGVRGSRGRGIRKANDKEGNDNDNECHRRSHRTKNA